MSSLTDKIYAQFTEEQLNSYQEQVTAAIQRGMPKQMIFQYFLQSAYATLEEVTQEFPLPQDLQNQIAVEIAHKLYMRATQNESDNNSSAGSNQEHSELLRSTQSEPGNDKDDEGV